jgi:hypothetical protein
MTDKSLKILIAICGILGTAALIAYFTAPFTFMPLPQPNATVEDIKQFGLKYRTAILLDTWLQQAGSFLSIVFELGLIHLAHAFGKFSAKLTLVSATVIMCLSLAEGTFALSATYAGDNHHYESSLTAFDLTNVFVHIFLLAPSLFLMMGITLLNTKILPRYLIITAIVLGCLFQILGVAGLFNNYAVLAVIFVLILQNIWTIISSVMLLVKPPLLN